MVLGLREDSDLVALETNEIIDFGTKSKLNEAIAFAPMKKCSVISSRSTKPNLKKIRSCL